MNSYIFAAIIAVLMMLGFCIRRTPRQLEVRDQVVLHRFNKDKGDKHAS